MRSIHTWGQRDVREIESISGERRRDKRYPMELQLRWKLVRRRRLIDAGTGCTVNISSGGIRFEGGRTLPAGLNVELAISWPVLLLNIAPMQLFVTGRILRSGEGWAAIRTVTHEFRTFSVGGSLNTELRTPGPLLPTKGATAVSGAP